MCNIDWSQAPAWIQAIGSVLAILVAIYIGRLSNREARELIESERRRQADIAASTLSTKFHLLNLEIDKKIEFASQIDMYINSSPDNPKIMLENLFLLSLHNTMLENRQNILLFERDTGILINNVFDVLESYNPTVEGSIVKLCVMGLSDDTAVTEFSNSVIKKLEYLKEVCTEAEFELEKVHELDKTSEQLET